MSEAGAGIIGILTILGVILGGLCCLAIPVVVVVIVVIMNKKKKEAAAQPEVIEVQPEAQEQPEQPQE